MGLWTRFRRWLGYTILPGTTQTQAVMSRERAVMELRLAVKRGETGRQMREMQAAAKMLRRNIPAGEGWRMGDSDPEEWTSRPGSEASNDAND
jgi:hypothetical protein